MPNLSSYPGGFPGGVAIHGMPVLNTYGGNVYWVNSTGGGDGNKGTRARPFATLDYAIGRCTANNGDIIMVMPNHAETITGASGITLDIAGITVLGMGVGNQRPRFLMDGGTTVTAVVSAADVALKNMVFAGGHDGIVTCFDVTGVNATFEDIEIEDNTTAEHFLVVIKATGAANTADGLTVRRCKWVTVDTGVTDFIEFVDTAKNVTVNDNYFCADAATGAGLILTATTKVLNGLECLRNVLICGNTTTDLLIDNDATTNTGVAAWNLVGSHDVAGAIVIDCDGIRQFQNYHTASDTASGLLLPVADVDTN
jgi:hypothetical protein